MRLTRRERAAFVALVERTVAPAPPLPAVAQTDALRAFAEWLAAAPRLNRAAMRAALVAPRIPAPMADPLRTAAAGCYYGDADVMRVVGYDPDARP